MVGLLGNSRPISNGRLIGNGRPIGSGRPVGDGRTTVNGWPIRQQCRSIGNDSLLDNILVDL